MKNERIQRKQERLQQKLKAFEEKHRKAFAGSSLGRQADLLASVFSDPRKINESHLMGFVVAMLAFSVGYEMGSKSTSKRRRKAASNASNRSSRLLKLPIEDYELLD